MRETSPSAAAIPAGSRVPGLDGLRALSIGLVVLSHAFIAWYRPAGGGAPYLLTPGAAGVTVFFCISGFIITKLLLREHEEAGRIDLKAFYVRRAFRVLPAFWLFLGVSALLRAASEASEYLRAAFFLSDYWLEPDWWLGHTWSLSVEEQFYLAWPLVLSALGPRRARTAIWAALLCAPIMRVAAYFALPLLRGREAYSFHTNADALLIGCLLALSPGFRATLRHGRYACGGLAYVLLVGPWLDHALRGRFTLTLGLSLRALAVGALVAWATAERAQRGWMRRLLNARPVVHLGVISYGLYLWQQPFFDSTVAGSWIGSLPWSVLVPILLAESSYRFLEQPVLRLRSRWLAPAGSAPRS